MSNSTISKYTQVLYLIFEMLILLAVHLKQFTIFINAFEGLGVFLGGVVKR